MNKAKLQQIANKCFWDQQSQIDVEDFIDLEKFATLIVCECATIALWEQGKGHDVSDIIKNNFGIKEN